MAFSSSISLDVIRNPVDQEMRQFDLLFKDALRSQVPLVDLVARYILRQKGKRVRPLLVLLSAKVCGGITESSYRAATLIEMLHTATLVHDDVVDDADMRRGLASINAVWKNKVAVLMGDYLLSRGLLLALKHQDYYFLNATSNAVKRMSEGELLQIQKSRHLNLDEPTYLKIISDKTASLFSACTDIGAASATDDDSQRQRMQEFGENIGLAFQIRDDLLDYLGRKSLLGKPTGEDIKEKKLTLPLIYALHASDKRHALHALRLIKRGASKKEIEWILNFVIEAGGVEYSLRRAEEFAATARQHLAAFPDSPAKTSLLQFVDFIIQRNN
ncbi:MAG TPA: polyprenyl synthetase family protein [Bacteroidota bacterium]|nr:polyprenyl synthetase family protein [Bacteroidota bacterium]